MARRIVKRWWAVLVFAVIAAQTAGPGAAGAQVAPQGNSGGLASLAFVSERLAVPASAPEVEALEDVQGALAAEVRDAWTAFELGTEGEWKGFIDKRTGRLEHAEGAGIPWIPGRGNRLAPGDIAAHLNGGSTVTAQTLERIARGFLPRLGKLLGVSAADLSLDVGRSGAVADYLWVVSFKVLQGGVPVEDAHVTFTVNNGNLIQIGAANLPAPGAQAPKQKLGREAALSVLDGYVGGFTAADLFIDGGSYRLLPVPVADSRFADGFALGRGRGLIGVWELVFRRDGDDGTWRARVDAVTGEVVEFADINDYARVHGGVMLGGVQTDLPMPWASLTSPPGGFCNTSGVYAWPGVPVTANFNGQFVRVLDSCGTVAETSGPNGDIDFGFSSGSNCSTPGHGGPGNTRSSRTQFYHLNRTKETARGWLPGIAWLSAQLTANVNINSTCNAFWNGSTVNFYRSGGGCGNTGEIEAVSLHEYGHGLDQFDGSGSSIDKGTGETYGDFTAALATHRSCIGAGFRTTNCNGYGDACTACTGVRDIDWALHATATPHTVANFTQVRCPNPPPTNPNYKGPCNKEGHCESYVSSEALWDLAARDLPGPGTPAAWTVVDRLWYLSRSTATRAFICTTTTNPWTSSGCATGTYWRTMRAVDDDDGNLSNGTPHGGALFAAFDRHGIACAGDPGANVTFAGCTPPAVPTVTLTPGDNQVSVSWTNSGAGVVYDIYRNELGCNSGFTKIANDVSASPFTDSGVANDFPYYYMVVAHPAGNEACASATSACQTVTPRQRTDVWSQDLPADNGNEPEPALLGQPMWQSQDIWVRNSPTPGPHENPEFGQVNYVHVTVRNRSAVTAHDTPVKVYYANASTGLAWDVDWTEIGTVVIPTLAGGATTEITVPWSPPGTGHYCLLSRLVTPQDPMTFAETSNVDYNTRYNNNIVWKNVNVVNLLRSRRVKVSFIFRNPDQVQRKLRLLFREVPGRTAEPFLRRGEIEVDFGDRLLRRMAEQQTAPVNFKQTPDGTYLAVDSAEGYLDITLDGREEYVITMLFTDLGGLSTGNQASRYTYEVTQEDRSSQEQVGGVAYVIDAPPI